MLKFFKSAADSFDIEKKVDEFIDSLPCKVQKPYPLISQHQNNADFARLLLDAYANGTSSELTAVTQYINHHQTIDEKDIADAELCIALVEMKHLHLIGNLIHSYGVDPKYLRANRLYWTGGYVNYGQSTCEKLLTDADAEMAAINAYQSLIRLINDADTRKLLKRIIEDEEKHLRIFQGLIKKYCQNT